MFAHHVDEPARHHVVSEFRTVSIDPSPDRPELPYRTGPRPSQTTTAFVTSIDIAYHADLESGTWGYEVTAVRGCLVAREEGGQPVVSPTVRDLLISRVVDRRWPAWIWELVEEYRPRTHVAVVERDVVRDPSTIVIEPGMSPTDVEAEVDRVLGPVAGTVRALRGEG